MATLICDNYSMLLVMSNFGIPLGVAEKSIEEVCNENRVDATSFLAVVNLLLRQGDASYKPSLEGVMASEVIKYLRNSHDFYINTRLPKIRTKLISALGDDTISKLIIKYFDDYFAEVKGHIRHEEDVLFAYVDRLSSGQSDGYSIGKFADAHNNVHEPLTEFKDIIIKYYSGGNSDIIGVIHDILSCAHDIALHTMIEDRLLVPLIIEMERE